MSVPATIAANLGGRNAAEATPVRMRLRMTTAVLAILVSLLSVGLVLAAGTFSDDDGSIHELSIEAIAAAGITKGCSPPANDRFCPAELVTRAQMAAFLARALGLSGPSGYLGTTFPVELLVGNHEDDNRVNGYIGNYDAGNGHYRWLEATIDDAREQGIEWVIVGNAGGNDMYAIDASDPELGYLATWHGASSPDAGRGYALLTVTPETLQVSFVGSTTSYSDSFVI